MELENIFDYFNNIKIISNYDGYFYSVNEVLKILLLAFFADVSSIFQAESLQLNNYWI